ncbi:MAG: NB-ARC domain-containing protein, partial [Cyanobacteria bacterium J06649_4]
MSPSDLPRASFSEPLFSDSFLTEITQAQRVSKSELAALKLALQNYKSKDIADQLGISEAAARKRLGEVYKKFKIKGRGPGKLAALEEHLISMAAKQGEPIGIISDAVSDKVSDKISDKISTQLSATSTLTTFGQPAAKVAPSNEPANLLANKQALSSLELVSLQKMTREDSVSPMPENPDFATRYHWHAAPHLNLFQGRRDDLKLLKRWMFSAATSYKLLALCGIGGIGKTYLALKLAKEVEGYFQQVIWLTAQANQPPVEFFQSLLQVLCSDEKTNTAKHKTQTNTGTNIDTRRSGDLAASEEPTATSSTYKTVQKLIQQVLVALNQQRCLVVIDGFEAFFRGAQAKTPTFEATPAQQASLYQKGFAAYGDFLEALQQSTTNTEKRLVSCVMLTSREKPRELAANTTISALAHLHTLNGMRDHEAARMLSSFHLDGKPDDYKTLTDRYSGHPMALRLAANAIKDLFYGRIRDFLEQEISVFDDLRGVIKTQFKRLSSLEIEVMYWLAINHVPCSLEELQADIVSQDHKKNLVYTLQSLERRSLVDVQQIDGALFSLHPIVAEYVLNKFIREIFQGLTQGKLTLFNSHALMKADAEESLREHQRDQIVRPILERLRNFYKSLYAVDQHLNQQLDIFRENNAYRLGYAGGNFVNLMVELSQGKLSEKDFSQLTIWQAYLQGAQLRDVNFNRCELNRSVFTETLSDVMAVAFSLPSQVPCVACGDTSGVVHLCQTDAGGRVQRGRYSHHSSVQQNSAQQSYGEKYAEWSAHSGWVRAIAFVPHRPFLVTGGDDKKLKLWQLPAPHQGPVIQAKQLWQTSDLDWVFTIAVSPDGRLIACGGEQYISLHHTQTGKEICRFSHQLHAATDVKSGSGVDMVRSAHPASVLARQARVRSLTFSPDGQWLVSAGDDHTIRVWSVADCNCADAAVQLRPDATLLGHKGCVRSLQFIPGTSQLVSGSDDKTVRLWDIEKQTCVYEFSHSSDRIRSIAVSPDGQLLASGGDDRQLVLWDLQTKKLLRTISTRQSRIWSIGFQQRHNKLLLAAGGDKQTLMLWQIRARQQAEMSPATSQTTAASVDAKERLVKTYRGYTNGIRSVSFLGDRRILSGGDSQDLCVWDSQTGEQTASLAVHQGRIWSLDVDMQNGRIASASDDHTIRLWDVNTGQCLTTLSEHTSWVRTVVFSYRGRFLASSGDDCSIRIWNTATGFCLKVLNAGPCWIHSVKFDPTNSR